MKNNFTRRLIKERLVDSNDEDLAYALDGVCRKHAEFGFTSVDEMHKSLDDIEEKAFDLGCRTYLQPVDSGDRETLLPTRVMWRCTSAERLSYMPQEKEQRSHMAICT